jgi:hypothetical protein
MMTSFEERSSREEHQRAWIRPVSLPGVLPISKVTILKFGVKSSDNPEA